MIQIKARQFENNVLVIKVTYIERNVQHESFLIYFITFNNIFMPNMTIYATRKIATKNLWGHAVLQSGLYNLPISE